MNPVSLKPFTCAGLEGGPRVPDHKWFKVSLGILVYSREAIGVTIGAEYYYCNSIDIAGSTIAILLLLWTTIAILL